MIERNIIMSTENKKLAKELNKDDKFYTRNEHNELVIVTVLEKLPNTKDILDFTLINIRGSRSDIPGKTGIMSIGENALLEITG